MTSTMLSSQILAVSLSGVVHQGSMTISTTALRSMRGISRRNPLHSQRREFRLGLWSSYLDPSFQKELQRRHRILKYKYLENLNRKLSWDRQIPNHMRRLGLKSFMCSAWRGRDRRPGGRWVDVEELETLRNRQRQKEGGIEEVEQNPVDRLLKDQQGRIEDFIRTRSQLFGFNWGISEKADVVTPESSQQQASSIRGNDSLNGSLEGANSSSEAEYEIDPITNRKVLKDKPESSRKAIEIPVKTYKGYRSGFQREHSAQSPGTSSAVNDGLGTFDSQANYGPAWGSERDPISPEKPNVTTKDAGDYDSRHTYGPVYGKEPDGKDANKPCPVEEGLKDYDSRVTYGPVMYKEPDGKDAVRPSVVQEGLEHYDQKTSYQPVYHNEPDGHNPSLPCSVQEGLRKYDEKVDYQPIYYQEADGKESEQPCSVREGLKDYDLNANYGSPQAATVDSTAREPSTGAERLSRYMSGDKTEDLDLLRASDIRARLGISKRMRKETEEERNDKRRQLEDAFARSQAVDETSPEESAAFEAVKKSRKLVEDLRIEHSELLNHVAHARGKVNAKIAEVEAGWQEPSKASRLTGNFVRDFPEEFETKWTSQTGTLTPSKNEFESYEQELASKVQKAEREYSDGLTSQSTLSRQSDQNRLQPSLDRGNASQVQSSKNDERRKHKELVQEIRSIYEDEYGTIDANHRQVPERKVDRRVVPATELEVPTVYKILAYDPTMQSISEAETTSIVPDSASPLTPAEVLLRLSNPAKFFPHFAPLQSQGYEIVSGSGDVLIFRKVRSAEPPKPKEEPEPSFAKREYKRRAMNPIDGMQPIAATGNFASPTGFVNHDLLEDDPPPEYRFKSNIDVRREEPVFSGKPNWQDGEEDSNKTKGKAKRLLIGAAWVGACSYAIGVVAEFFKTGGADGLGPKGF